MKNKLNPKFIFSAIIVLVASISFAQVSMGAASDSTNTIAEQVKITEEISAFEFLKKGGVFLIPIGILLFYTIVVIVERALYISRKLNKPNIADAFVNIFNYNGRASKSEFWSFWIFSFITNLILYLFDTIWGFPVLSLLFGLIASFVNLSLAIRRMHDVGKSGGYAFIPLYNLMLLLREGEDGRNQFGANPQNSMSIIDQVRDYFPDNIQEAQNIISNDQSAYASAVREGIFNIARSHAQIESNMERVANIEIGKMEKNISHLGLIAGIAPTLGFIGTISGVIKIFYMISITENVSIGNISGGLYEKMISSGSGLIVGIIAYTGYHLLNGMIDSYALGIQRVNMEFVKLIQRPSNGDKA